MKQIMFSRVFPAYHPKAGQPTYFVEKIWKGLWDAEPSSNNPLFGYWEEYDQLFPVTYDINENIHQHTPKVHTIRAGNRWKVGDMFSPKVWSGKPYRSKTVTIAPPIEIVKVWPFVITKGSYWMNGAEIGLERLTGLARNDGLTCDDLKSWFAPYGKKGPEECQIICWNKNVNY